MTGLDLRTAALGGISGSAGADVPILITFLLNGEPWVPTSVSAWTGGTVEDTTDLADATETVGTIVGNVATIAYVIPVSDVSLNFRITVDGVVKVIDKVYPSTAGTVSPSDPLTVEISEGLNLTLENVGEVGPAPDVESVSTTTAAPGADAVVGIDQDPDTKALAFAFDIPRGDTGETGPPPELAIGTVTTLDPGEEATADVVPDGPGAYTIDLGLVTGPTGATGPAQSSSCELLDNSPENLILSADHPMNSLFNFDSPVTVTIPANADVPLPVDYERYLRARSGVLQFDMTDVVNWDDSFNARTTPGGMFVKKIALPDTWLVEGGTTEAVLPPAVLTDVGWQDAFWCGGLLFSLTNPVNDQKITVWPNETGTGDFEPISAGRGWTYRASSADFNDKPVLYSDGNACMLANLADIAAIAGVHKCTVVAVARFASTNGAYNMVDGLNSSSRHIIRTNTGNKLSISQGGTAQDETVGSATTTAQLYMAVYDTTDVLSAGGVEKVSGGAGVHPFQGLTIGGRHDGAANLVPAGSELAFLGVIPDVPTVGEVSDIESWAVAEYDVPVA